MNLFNLLNPCSLIYSALISKRDAFGMSPLRVSESSPKKKGRHSLE